MVANRLVEASEAVLSSELIDAGALLLDIRTNSGTAPDQSGWRVTAWPSCSEATVTVARMRSSYVDYVAPFEHQFGSSSRVGGSDESPDELRSRQGKTAVRRFGRHNSLTELITFTYAEVPRLTLVQEHIQYFWYKWKAVTGRPVPAYMWVPEWGKEEGRLHIHMGVSWWAELGAVEVCDACATDGLREKRRDIPAAGGFCIGELWGRGFVGRPESNLDGRGLSRYLSKYIAKDLGSVHYDPQTGRAIEFEGVPFGGHRYHLSRGHKPTAVVVWVPDLCVARQAAMEVAGAGEAPQFSKVIEAQDSNFGRMEYLDFVGGGDKENVQNL